MNGKDFTIGILSVTAVVLFTAIVLVQAVAPKPAIAAAGTGSPLGQFVIGVAQADETTDLVYILDTVSQRMNAYGYDVQTGQIVLVSRDLDVRPLQARTRR